MTGKVAEGREGGSKGEPVLLAEPFEAPRDKVTTILLHSQIRLPFIIFFKANYYRGVVLIHLPLARPVG